MLLLVNVHPAVRIAIGLVVLVIGVVLHKVLIDVAGAVVVAVGAVQWFYRRRGGAR